MDVTTLRIAATVVSFLTFIVIWGWAWARANRAAFDEASRIPLQQD